MVTNSGVTADLNEKKVLMRPYGIDRNPAWVQAVIYGILTILSLITLLPMINVLALSFSEAEAIYRNPMMLVPEGFTFNAYQYIFSTQILFRSFGITLFAAVVGTALNLLFTTTAAYALSKKYLPGQKLMLWFVIVPMLFGAGLIPMYVILKALHLLDSIWVLVLPSLVAPFYLILMRNFYWSIPDELEECPKIDGANDLQILWHVILPLSKPALATIGLFYAVGHWNDLFTGLFYINDNTKWPLPVLLRSIIIDMNALNMRGVGTAMTQDTTRVVLTPENIKSAVIIFSIVPILLVYPFLQKYFVKGIMLGSVKG